MILRFTTEAGETADVHVDLSDSDLHAWQVWAAALPPAYGHLTAFAVAARVEGVGRDGGPFGLETELARAVQERPAAAEDGAVQVAVCERLLAALQARPRGCSAVEVVA
jgi:hypothetical protein